MEIIAHRGASHAAPENTVASARLAWTEGADALELDVRLTADGELAVIHDENTRRIAGESLVVASSRMEELKTLDVGRWKGAKFVGEKIPTLTEILAGAPEGKRVFIEMKSGLEAVGPLERCLARQRMAPGQIAVISFDLAVVSAAKQALPQHAAAWILDYGAATQRITFDAITARCQTNGLDALDLGADWPIDAALVARAHRAGLKLYVWTVDDPALARRFAVAGVDGIATNRPGWMRAQLAN